ncbi:MAG: hypothetical protein QG671_3496 [Actinomycetota bacterium]|nr:hypothetical protein [Actinomycetota bacterium]
MTTTRLRYLIMSDSPDPNVIFDETFSGSLPGPDWVTVDTTGKLTVAAGVLSCAGGKPSPAWGDPAIRRRDLVPHEHGLTLEVAFTPTSGNWWTGFCFDELPGDPAAADALYAWDNVAGAIRAYIETVQQGQLLYTLAAQSYVAYVQLLTDGGVRWYLSADGGYTAKLLWEKSNGGNTGSFYPTICNYDGIWTADRTRLYVAVPKSPLINITNVATAPSIGANLFTDPGLEGTYTGGLCAALFVDSGTPTMAQSADAYAGSKAQQFTAAARYDRLAQSVTVVAGTFYRVGLYAKRLSGTGGGVYGRVYDGATWYNFPLYTDAAYTRKVRIVKAATTDMVVRVVQDNNITDFDTVVVDNAAVESIDLASCLNLAGDAGTREGIFDSHPTLASASECGHAIGVDSETTPTYGIFAFHDGANAHLCKLVNGAWTSLVDASASYGAARQIRIHSVGTTFTLYYNNTLIGAAQTIADAGFGTKVCRFSTDALNSAGTVVVHGGLP